MFRTISVDSFIKLANFSAIDKGLIATANNSGLRGHPWRVPLLSVKYWDFIPLVLTDALGEEYKNEIQDIYT